jgi:hypothetical protein
MTASLWAKNELEKEGTNQKKVTDAVLGNKKKHGTHTKQSWPNTIRENQREKPKRGLQLEHIELLTTRYERS